MKLICFLGTLLCFWPLNASAQWPMGRESAAPSDTKSSENLSASGTGRFQMFVSPQAKGFTFMIDTETGKIWIMKKDHSTGEFSMQRVPVEQVDPQQPSKSQAGTSESGKSK